jgi:hypothetical protein
MDSATKTATPRRRSTVLLFDSPDTCSEASLDSPADKLLVFRGISSASDGNRRSSAESVSDGFLHAGGMSHDAFSDDEGSASAVKLTPVTGEILVPLADRQGEMQEIIASNPVLFGSFEKALGSEEFAKLRSLWVASREDIPDPLWLKKTEDHLESCLMARFRIAVGADMGLSGVGAGKEPDHHQPTLEEVDEPESDAN